MTHDLILERMKADNVPQPLVTTFNCLSSLSWRAYQEFADEELPARYGEIAVMIYELAEELRREEADEVLQELKDREAEAAWLSRQMM